MEIPTPTHPELPATADHPAMQPVRAKRSFGVRLWLALMFAAIGILTGTSVYIFVSGSSENAATARSQDIAIGSTFQLREEVEAVLPAGTIDASERVRHVLGKSRSDSFRSWLFDDAGKLVTTPQVFGFDIGSVPNYGEGIHTALGGDTYVQSGLPGDSTVVALQVVGAGGAQGALLTLAERPEEVRSALQALRGERLTALSIAVLIAAIIGFLVASLISSRVKRLAAAAEQIAQGRLDIPMNSRGRDEIGDLGRVLDSMRIALAATFNALSSERDRLSAIFTSLDEAVIVVGSDGDVRFANPAAAELIKEDGTPIDPLRPWIRRATHRGAVDSEHVPVGDKVYAIDARNLPAENSALIVVRDRTEELRRDEAEREFVSNAAHELRNPIAGMSGAIEVLRSGAKDDPEARDHFLDRLATDVERVSRLTKSLLTLARMESIGEGEADVVSVGLVVDEAISAIEKPDGIELTVEVAPDLAACAEPALLRQVLIGLLTNAFKHTNAPGAVTLRAQQEAEESVLIEVEDTGTGIAPEERDRVFERFYRGSGSLEREGFGLGLAIAKRMVDVMGGDISVDSEEGRGSTFRIRLRQAAPSPTPVA